MQFSKKLKTEFFFSNEITENASIIVLLYKRGIQEL